jgi:hypothetical protein
VIPITLQARSTTFDAGTVRESFATAWGEAGAVMRRDLATQRFGAGAAQRFGYAPRDPGYETRKARFVGHRRPLVFTGRLEEEVREQRSFLVTRSESRTTLTIPLAVPDYVTQKRSGVDLADELARVSDSETQVAARTLERSLVASLNRETAPRAVGV